MILSPGSPEARADVNLFPVFESFRLEVWLLRLDISPLWLSDCRRSFIRRTHTVAFALATTETTIREGARLPRLQK
jgi:hypothetical protein